MEGVVMRKLLPVILALIGLVAGAGGGYMLRPGAAAPAHGADATAEAETGHGAAAGGAAAPKTSEYVKIANQFVIPVVEDGRVASLVIMTLNLEVAPGSSEKVYGVEPKLRDQMLQVLFNHANSGGFRGAFTETARLESLRKALLEAARTSLGDTVRGVLISDIVRQDSP